MNDTKIWDHPSVKKTESCWVWTGGNRLGYGLIKVGPHKTRRTVSVHRLAYEQANGEIPAGLHVCHTCDNPSCLNPKHLYVGTVKQNMKDRSARGRAFGQSKTHCKHGHEFNAENTYIYSGHRACLACKKTALQRSRDKNRAKYNAQASAYARRRRAEKREQ